MKRLIRRILPTSVGIRLFPIHGKALQTHEAPHLQLAHLTDLHFSTATNTRYPTGPAVLKHAVAALNEQDLDAVVFTGDLFDEPHRIKEDAPVFSALMRNLRHPWYVALGNHDVEGPQSAARKAYLAETLGDSGLSASGNSYYEVEVAKGVRLIVLDTTDNGDDDYLGWKGNFSQRQATWLDNLLTRAAYDLVIVALHHPPVAPYPLMNVLKFEDLDKKRLQAVLTRHPHVAALLCGHFHMAGCLPFAATHVLAGPGLIEHPHHYRTFDVMPEARAIRFDERTVPVPEADCEACVDGRAGFRSRLLGRLGHARGQGHVPIDSLTWRPIQA